MRDDRFFFHATRVCAGVRRRHNAPGGGEKKKVSSPTSAPREIADLKISDAINRSFIVARRGTLRCVPAMTRVNLLLNDFFNPRASVRSCESRSRFKDVAANINARINEQRFQCDNANFRRLEISFSITKQ